ncbi:hypothetical protein ACIGHF_00465 [Stenotrophomonas sp. NPDC077464]|uniref:hypothetical protein n=1 Tax=unclassified Stenotrophomonas TaxID=196198 RepID=UPI0037CDBFA7
MTEFISGVIDFLKTPPETPLDLFLAVVIWVGVGVYGYLIFAWVVWLFVGRRRD